MENKKMLQLEGKVSGLFKTNKSLKIAIVIMVIFILATIPCYKFMNIKVSYKMPADGYQMSLGYKVKFGEGTRLTFDETEGLKADNGQDMTQIPLYMKHSDMIVMPSLSVVVSPYEMSKSGKLKYFAEVSKRNRAFYADDGKERILNDCFLYDGGDVYVFLDDVDLRVGDTKIAISPMSYVYAPYGGTGAIYNYDTGKYTEIPEGYTQVTAYLENGYTLYLDTDRLDGGNSGMILPHNPGSMKSYK